MQFSESQTVLMRNNYLNFPAGKHQVQHCADQLYRFANLAENGRKFRSAQFGYNLGRLQEMILPEVIFWKHYEPLILEKNWAQIKLSVMQLIETVGMQQPDPELINRI